MKTEPRIVPLSALRDNYIWSLDAAGHCVVVDPGEAAPVLQHLQAHGLKLSAILITHQHADHSGGVEALLAHAPVPVFGPQGLACVSHPVTDGMMLALPGTGLMARVLATPGHTPEHLSYLCAGHLFCGDTLFAAGCGRLLLGGTAAQLHASLQTIASLPSDTHICCAHEYTLANLRFAAKVEPGNPLIAQRQAHCAALREAGTPTLPATLGEELATNPFLRCAEPAVRAAAETAAAATLDTPLAVFTALRAWKDRF